MRMSVSPKGPNCPRPNARAAVGTISADDAALEHRFAEKLVAPQLLELGGPELLDRAVDVRARLAVDAEVRRVVLRHPQLLGSSPAVGAFGELRLDPDGTTRAVLGVVRDVGVEGGAVVEEVGSGRRRPLDLDAGDLRRSRSNPVAHQLVCPGLATHGYEEVERDVIAREHVPAELLVGDTKPLFHGVHHAGPAVEEVFASERRIGGQAAPVPPIGLVPEHL